MSTTLSLVLGATQNKSGSSILSILPLVLIFVAMYFLLLKPQRKRQKQARTLQSALTVGDEVILVSGIYGFVNGVDDDFIWLDIAEHPKGSKDAVEIRVARSAIARVVAPSTDAKPTDAK